MSSLSRIEKLECRKMCTAIILRASTYYEEDDTIKGFNCLSITSPSLAFMYELKKNLLEKLALYDVQWRFHDIYWEIFLLNKEVSRKELDDFKCKKIGGTTIH